MKKSVQLIFVIFLITAALYLIVIFNDKSSTPSVKNPNQYLKIFQISDALPQITENGHQIITHTAYMLSYNELEEQADWVAYILTAADVQGTAKRKDNFRSDTLVSTGSASVADYKYSGYDRGHLAPAADMKASETIMAESFFMSNMSPQKASFNRGIWKKLEENVRDWAVQHDSLYIVTGPVFKDIETTIGANEVAVPGYYFKAILDISYPAYSAVAFILKNEGSKDDIFNFAVSVDSLEQFTGYDFFYQLDDGLEKKLESTFDKSYWK